MKIIEVVLSPSESKFVCESLIGDFIKSENIIISFDTKFSFHIAALDFIEKNYTQLLSAKGLEDALDNVLFMQIKPQDREQYISLVNRVYEISNRDESTLANHLSSIGVKSSNVTNSDEKLELLRELIGKCPTNTDNKRLLFLKCQA